MQYRQLIWEGRWFSHLSDSPNWCRAFLPDHISCLVQYKQLIIPNHKKQTVGLHTNMSSFPTWVLMKFAKEEMLAGAVTSSWWKITWEYPAALSFSTASLPLFTSLAVNITFTPFEASCLHISNPNPLLAPVTTVILKIKVWNICKSKEIKGEYWGCFTTHIKTLYVGKAAITSSSCLLTCFRYLLTPVYGKFMVLLLVLWFKVRLWGIYSLSSLGNFYVRTQWHLSTYYLSC